MKLGHKMQLISCGFRSVRTHCSCEQTMLVIIDVSAAPGISCGCGHLIQTT